MFDRYFSGLYAACGGRKKGSKFTYGSCGVATITGVSLLLTFGVFHKNQPGGIYKCFD